MPDLPSPEGLPPERPRKLPPPATILPRPAAATPDPLPAPAAAPPPPAPPIQAEAPAPVPSAPTGAAPAPPAGPPGLGEALPLPAHAPLRLDDPAARWLVTEGEVSLFAQRPPLAGTAEGPRRFLGSVPAGGLLCGLGEDDAGTVVIAVGTAETRLAPLDPATLLATEGGAIRLAGAVMLWAQALAEGLSRPMQPRPRADLALSIESGTLRPRAGMTLAARGAPLLARLAGGPFLLFGLEPVTGLIPLPPAAWMTGGGEVQPLPVAEAIADPSALEGLAAYNAACLGALPAALALDAADEINRLRLRAARDSEAEGEQAGAFAAILGNTMEEEAPADGDPLTPVFRLVASRLGVRVKRPVRARRTDVDALPTLEELARASGVRLRPVRLPDAWWEGDSGALVGRLLDGTPVALLPRRGGYWLHDAGRLSGVKVDAGLAGLVAPMASALLLPLPRKVLGLMDLLGAGMRGAGGDATALGLSLLLGAALGQAVPLATGVAFSLLIPGGHLSELAQLGLALAVVASVSWMVKIGGEIARNRIEARAGPALHAAIWDRVLRQPLSVLGRQTVGETTGRANAAISIAMQLRAFGFMLSSSAAMILGAGVLMLWTQPAAAGVAIGLLLVQVAAANAAGWLQSRAFATGEALTGLADAMIFQIVSGLTKLRLAGAEARAQAVWAGRFAEMRRRLAAARRISNGYDAFAAGFAILSTAGAFLVIALLQRVEPGEPPPSLAQVMSFISAYGIMSAAGVTLGKAMFGLWFMLPSLKFAKPLLEGLPEAEGGRVDPGRLSGGLELAGVTFRYPGADTAVFQGLSLRIEPGEFVAIVGRSGAGKSTLVRLMLGLEDPVAGAIYYDGQDLRALDLTAVRRQVATVLQNGRVPPGAIRDAVRGLTEATDAEVWQALARAALADDVKAMPMGLETLVTDATRVLSGGQAQRLLLARALVQKPAVLVLDEATSALDNITQRATMRAVRAMPATRIVIAHRLSTIRHADRIIVLQDGRIAEMGSFQQLMARKGGIFWRQYNEELRWQTGATGAKAPA
jgi:ABC-type bacteriocin/lantibiotic exporter with double-glycine peptidase domain